MFYCMFYFACDRSLRRDNSARLSSAQLTNNMQVSCLIDLMRQVGKWQVSVTAR